MGATPPSKIAATPGTLVLVRHGESEFNARQLFTGWADPPLTVRGRAQAMTVAHRLKARGLRVDTPFCSSLLRARESLQIILEELGLAGDFASEAALKERDYGALTGVARDAAAARWGDSQVRRWRRGYRDAPPHGESLRDTVARVLPCYVRLILPALMRGQTTLVVAHGNSLRALIMALEGLTEDAIADVEVRTGEIRLYELGRDTAVRHRSIIEA